MKYRVTINHQTASLRTRRIVKKHGSIFTYEDVKRPKLDHIYLVSETTNWRGHLPLNEIELN